MIFANIIRAHRRGFQVDPSDLERIGIFDRSVCWGVWVPDPRGHHDHPRLRKHLLISPIPPTVWPYLLRLEVKLRDVPGSMAEAAAVLAQSNLNIQFGESAISGHHHATWNVVADAIDVRSSFDDSTAALQRMAQGEKVYTNPELKDFSNKLASRMLAKEIEIPKRLVAAHKSHETYEDHALECGFLHNRIVDEFEFFYDSASLTDPELIAAAERGHPQAVTCRWMKNLAFFSVYGDMGNALRLQYDEPAGLLKLLEPNRLDTTLHRQRQRTTLPTSALASYDTSELYLRIDILEPGEVGDRYLESTIQYDIGFDSGVPGRGDSAPGVWRSICEEVAKENIDLVKISNRTTDRDHRVETGSVTLIGRADSPIPNSSIERLNAAFERECRPSRKLACDVNAKTNRFRTYTVFVSRRIQMPRLDDINRILEEVAADSGMTLDFVQDRLGRGIDEEVERGVRDCDGILQIVSYSAAELAKAREHPEYLPDLQWLFHEYGMAIGARKPHVRVFDTTNRTLQDWKRVVSPASGEAAAEYRSDAATDEIRREFRKAFSELKQRIDKRHREQPGIMW